MKAAFWVFIGGGAGSVLRYLIQLSVHRGVVGAFPVSTFWINILGSLFIGMAYTLSERFSFSNEARLLLIVGFCGGFTTFSTFSNENLNLLKAGLYGTFTLYTLLSVTLGILFALAGVWLARNI